MLVQVARFQSVVAKAAGVVLSGNVGNGKTSKAQPKQKPAFTQKLAGYLAALCRRFSVWYTRVKVLNPRPRKLPLVQARLLSLAAVLQVLKNGLKLMGVDAVESM